jgi:hypothetical protein
MINLIFFIMIIMEVPDLAQVSQLHYNEDFKKDIETKYPTYKVDETSDVNVLGMYDESIRELVINHRGTSKPLDVLSDYMKLRGMERYDPQYNSRRRHTKEMLKRYPQSENTILIGHSLGGDTALHAMHQSPSLANRVDKVHVFNPLNVSKYKKEDSLKSKIKIHRVDGDLVSVIKQPYKTLIYMKGKNLNARDAHRLDHFYRGQVPRTP